MTPLRVYFGHHKCATIWVCDIIRDVCAALELKQAIYHDPKQFDHNLSATVTERAIDFLCLVNAGPRYPLALPAYKGFHLVRDPRDIVVSAYFSHAYTHYVPNRPWLNQEYRDRLQSVDEATGLSMVLERSTFRALREWNYENPAVLEVRFERVTMDPPGEFRRIFGFLDLLEQPGQMDGPRISDATLDGILERHAFAKKSHGRQPGEEDRTSHYRSGKPGDWRNHFGPGHIQYFKEHYNDLLVTLGYESSADW